MAPVAALFLFRRRLAPAELLQALSRFRVEPVVETTRFFLVMVLLTHQYARIVGPLWVAAAIGLFAMYRRNRGLPIFKTMPRDWETATKRVLLEAEEFKSLEEYEAALQEHRERSPGQQ